MARKFTLDEANSLLPHLADLLAQAQRSKLRHDQLRRKVAQHTQKMSSNGHIIEKELNKARQELAQAAAELRTATQNVQETGCELKDIDEGLVDFQSDMDGREVYLCWKLGEPAIRWWHDLESGFAGRRPLE